MNPFSVRFAKKSIAASVSAALLMLSPGPGVYEALAQFNLQAGVGSMAAPGGQAGAGLSLRGTPIRGMGVDAVALDLSAATLPSLRAGTDVRLNGAPMRAVRAVSDPAQSAPLLRPQAASPASFAGTAAIGDEAAPSVAAGSALKDASADASLPSLLSDRRAVALPAAEIGAMNASGAREAGVSMMDRVLGLRYFSSQTADEPAALEAKAPASGLNVSQEHGSLGEPQRTAIETLQKTDTAVAPSSARGKAAGLVKSLAAVAASGAAGD
ncbi:MAG: hypothetical protein AAB339_08035 [Elusimicrobiota bacterium]